MIDREQQASEYQRATAGEWGDKSGAASWGVIAVIGMFIAGAFVFLRIKGVL